MNNNPKPVVYKLTQGIYLCLAANKTAKNHLTRMLYKLSKIPKYATTPIKSLTYNVHLKTGIIITCHNL